MTTNEEQEARDRLHELLPPGTTVYTILRHVSSSGMTRDITPFVVNDGEPVDLTWLAVKAFGFRAGPKRGVRVGGVGMDMGYDLVYRLSRRLYPDGFGCTGDSCPSNDHINREDNDHHRDGGYALKHRWF
jgi:hypothetical protein